LLKGGAREPVVEIGGRAAELLLSLGAKTGVYAGVIADADGGVTVLTVACARGRF